MLLPKTLRITSEMMILRDSLLNKLDEVRLARPVEPNRLST